MYNQWFNIKWSSNCIDHFVQNEGHYYTVDTNNEWVYPIENPIILIFYDESTFQSAEQAAKI
jgi:hypothetical protein